MKIPECPTPPPDKDAGKRRDHLLVRPWDWIETNQRKALRMVGISFREQADSEDLRAHVVAEDPRYPLLCVNGDLNFGVRLDAETGLPEGGRGCICHARDGDTCICDLGTNAGSEAPL